MWKDDDAFMQIPHMNEERVKKLKRHARKPITIEDFTKLTPEERKGYNLFENPQEYEDSEQAISVFPLINLKVETFVDGEQEIAVGDFLTYKFTITLVNLKDGEQQGFVHSNKFPLLKQSQWYLLFTDMEENDFFRMEKVQVKDKVCVIEQKQRVTNPGKLVFKVILKNDSYKGFDKTQNVEVTVLKDVKRAEV